MTLASVRMETTSPQGRHRIIYAVMAHTIILRQRMSGFHCRIVGFQASESRFPISRNAGFRRPGHWCHEARNTQQKCLSYSLSCLLLMLPFMIFLPDAGAVSAFRRNAQPHEVRSLRAWDIPASPCRWKTIHRDTARRLVR